MHKLSLITLIATTALLLPIIPGTTHAQVNPIQTFTVPEFEEITAWALSPDKRTIALAHKEIVLLDRLSKVEIQRFDGMDYPIYALAFSHDGKYLAAAVHKSIVKVWEIASDKEILTLHTASYSARPEGGFDGTPISNLVFSSDLATFLTAEGVGNVQLWDVNTKEEIWEYQAGPPINRIEFSSDQDYILVSFVKGAAILSYDTGDAYYEIDWGGAARLSNNGKSFYMIKSHFIEVELYNEIVEIQMSNGEILWTSPNIKGFFASGVIISKQGRLLYTKAVNEISGERIHQLVSTYNGQVVCHLSNSGNNELTGVAFLSNENNLVGIEDNTFLIFDLLSHTPGAQEYAGASDDETAAAGNTASSK